MNAARNIAVIREDECIGCAKCIQVCPVDAIIGARKLMHTVIANACTGCELCLAPCPVDCIDIVSKNADDFDQKEDFAVQSAQREHHKRKRLNRQKLAFPSKPPTLRERQAFIEAAVARQLAKKNKSVCQN